MTSKSVMKRLEIQKRTFTERLAEAEVGVAYGTLFNLARDYERRCGEQQAKIDRLMLEFCPGEMTVEQKEQWAAAQRAV